MAEDATKDVVKSSGTEKKDKKPETTKKRKGLLSRIWNGVFRSKGHDFEKRLQYISKEEASALARLKKRAVNSRKLTRNLIIFSVFFEVIAVGYAIMTTRSLDMNWKMRTSRVLPMFLLPGLSFAIYSAVTSFMRMCLVSYCYILIVGDDTKLRASTGKSSDMELVQSSGLRNRKPVHIRPSTEKRLQSSSSEKHHDSGGPLGSGSPDVNQPVVVEHHQHDGSGAHDGGWISRIAALLVGEDPTQSCALICGNCHMHNGLARKEEYPYVTYYCPHCRALNKSKQLEDHGSGSSTSNLNYLRAVGSSDMLNREITAISNNVPRGSSPASPGSVSEE